MEDLAWWRGYPICLDAMVPGHPCACSPAATGASEAARESEISGGGGATLFKRSHGGGQPGWGSEGERRTAMMSLKDYHDGSTRRRAEGRRSTGALLAWLASAPPGTLPSRRWRISTASSGTPVTTSSSSLPMTSSSAATTTASSRSLPNNTTSPWISSSCHLHAHASGWMPAP